MFRGFANVWTIATAQRLRRDAPLAVTVAGERVVFFRDREGVARALLDRCPHRGVQLSLGAVRDGCLVCPFHGWSFAGDGAVCEVPYNPDARREQLGATVIPCEEHAGMLWIYTAPTVDGRAPAPLELPGVLADTALRHVVDEVVWRTHWTRAMENMLDWPHLPFVHATTIGREMRAGLRREARMDLTLTPTSSGVHSTIAIDGRAQPGGLDWVRPNMMVLHIDPPGRLFKNAVACVPVDEATTRLVLIGSRGFLRAAVLDPLFVWANRRIAAQDRAVVESSWPAEVPPGREERSVRTDRLTLMFRKHYHEHLRASAAEPPGRRALPVLDDD
ncbi:MAG: aromatic ring-hydroxylating dioxygenase subunit alpha [Polyangiales bacterium]